MPEVLQGPHPPQGSSEVWPFAIARPRRDEPSAKAVNPADVGTNTGRAQNARPALARNAGADHAR